MLFSLAYIVTAFSARCILISSSRGRHTIWNCYWSSDVCSSDLKPVGSALVAKKGGFELSPASLRSEMCELEQAGYLSQLHTSGGRVPTDKAYRFYVNNLNTEKEDA